MAKNRNFILINLFLMFLLVGMEEERLLANPSASPDGKYALTDKAIVFAVEARLMVDPNVPENAIDVETQDGIVTLSGRVKTLFAKDRATKIIESVRGVQAVINLIDVVSMPVMDDEELREQIKIALARDPATESFEVGVTCHQGVVTLNGIVDSWQEKQLSSQVAEAVKGVVRVDNRLKISPAAVRQDFDIKAEIIRRLQSDVWVDGKLIGVMVDAGKVTLSGSVGSLAEKYSAFTDAWVSGVVAVNMDPLQIDWKARDKMRRNPAELFRTSEQIQEALQTSWKYDPRVDSSRIDVNVKEGSVTLTGEVTDLRARRVAAEDAENTVGVFRVRNFIKVRPIQLISDEELEQKVQKAFQHNALIHRYEIKISAQRGTVFLDGYVDSSFEVTQAVHTAETVKGVRQVVNRLKHATLSNGKSDEEIWRDIMQAIWWDPRLYQEEIHVQVQGGDVTLTGSVFSLQDLQTLSQIARDAGAVNVQNRVKVKYAPSFLSAKFENVISPFQRSTLVKSS